MTASGQRSPFVCRFTRGTYPIPTSTGAGHDPETINLDTWTRLLAWLNGRSLCLVYDDTPARRLRAVVGIVPPPPGAVNVAQLVEDALHGADVTRRTRRKIYRSGQDVAVRNKEQFSGHSVVTSYDEVLFRPHRWTRGTNHQLARRRARRPSPTEAGAAIFDQLVKTTR